MTDMLAAFRVDGVFTLIDEMYNCPEWRASSKEQDSVKLEKMREALATGVITTTLSSLEKLVAQYNAPYAIGADLTVADLAIYTLVLTQKSGKPGIPSTITDPYQNLQRVFNLHSVSLLNLRRLAHVHHSTTQGKPSSTMAPTKIPVGLVGFGTGSSVFHAPLVLSSGQFELTHVLERSTSKSQSLSPAPKIVRSMDELLNTDVQLVVISTPTTVHFEQAKLAMEAKRHVVVDKPLCVTAQQAKELCAIAKANGVIFSVFHNRRFDCDFLTVRSLIEDGTLGEVQKFEVHYDRYRPIMKGYWKEKAGQCGGVLYDLGAHVTDQALQLFGKPDSVVSDVQIQREGAENDDFFRLEFKYNKFPEREVILSAGMLVKELGPKYTVVGTKGTFEKYGEDIQEDALRAGKRPGDAGWGQEPETAFGKFTDATTGETRAIPSKLGSYEVYYKNIAAVIRGEEALLVDPEEVIEQIRIIEEAKKTERVNRISV
ncbi:hypothetical protein JM16_009003 [Phytophthora kernoviae]|uniref:Oxidoreductase n=1 Tax=Phytophthora kernoviae TaxID=325452 RepID=A0A8T0LML2_9STRA|nr:hypothetical protein JM16_009003 [Phytophthora kernoviae]